MSSYRGEDGSQGSVEICDGEVDDSLQLLALVDAQPYADPSHAGMIGASHGGCITLRAVARGAPVVAAADLFGPVHWAAIETDLAGRLALGIAGDLAPAYQAIVDQLLASTGGTPDQVPDAYAAQPASRWRVVVAVNAFPVCSPSARTPRISHGGVP
jgi:hypothetical protein